MKAGLIVDLFAGGGGASTGIEAALGRSVDIAINHDPIALAVHKANHPGSEHFESNIWEVKPLMATRGRPVDLLWASPDCTHFSVAKGGKPRKQNIRSLAWVVVRWANEVRPTVICLENVSEFKGWGPLGKDGKPVKQKMGQTFRAWSRKLERLGYVVDYRVCDASTYGAPTKRRRLFLVARCDGQPIRWPNPTHGKGLKPLHTAAECIDWSLPCPSIFERKRPLAEKTLWRVAQGVRRFVLEAARPFIVKVNHGKADHRTESIDQPLTTITASQRGHALVAPTLIQIGYGEREGQAARVPGLEKPFGTIVAGGQKHALVAAFLNKHFGGVVGRSIDQPAITAKDHHSLTAATLVKMRGQCHGAQLDLPLPTITASGTHLAEVRAFLTAYHASDYAGGYGANLLDPMRTLTTKDRLGLVIVEGCMYEIADIGLRMLQPHELLRAQFGRFAAGYDLSPAKTKSAKVRLIGNSVSPENAEAIVRANAPHLAQQVAA